LLRRRPTWEPYSFCLRARQPNHEFSVDLPAADQSPRFRLVSGPLERLPSLIYLPFALRGINTGIKRVSLIELCPNRIELDGENSRTVRGRSLLYPMLLQRSH
jgi:hypothetical protein